MPTTTYKLYYFDARGRAEISRTLLAISGVEFEDIRFSRDDFPEKYKHLAPFGQVPFLEINDGTKTEKICQSMAIAGYLAKKFGWIGKSELEEAQVNMIAACIEEYLLTPCPFIRREKDPQKKAKLLKIYREETLPSGLSLLETQLKKNKGGDEWFVGSKMSWADICLAHWIRWIPDGVGVTPDMEKLPKLEGLVARVESQSAVASYMQRRPVTDN